jgi:hypothetical protein
MLALLCAAAVGSAGLEARAASSPELGLFIGSGVLASPAGVGAPLEAGVRLELARHFAVSFDLGYSLMSAQPHLQDRWWLMPAAALVLPLGSVRLDIGAGLGMGTSSAFGSWDAFSGDHTSWKLEYCAAVRAHASASVGVGGPVEVYLRTEASGLLTGRGLGCADATRPGTLADATWASLGVGLQLRLTAARRE